MTGHNHPSPIHRLALALLLALLLALTSVAFAAASAPARAQGEVRIGYQKFNTTLLVLKAQQELEHRLGDLGYTVTWSEFQAGLPMFEALNAGSIDFAATGAGPPVFAQANGTDLVYVFASRPAPHTEGILVPRDSPITSVAELQGKKVAVQKGSNAHALLAGSLLAAGLPADAVSIEFLAPADARAAFEGGSVDAWSIWDPYYAAEEDATGARSIADGEFAWQNNRTFYLAARGFATAHPDAIEALRAAIEAGEVWSESHQPDVAKLVSTETGIAESTLIKVEARSGFGLELTLSDTVITEQQTLADLFFDLGVIQKKVAVIEATLPATAGATPTN